VSQATGYVSSSKSPKSELQDGDESDEVAVSAPATFIAAWTVVNVLVGSGGRCSE